MLKLANTGFSWRMSGMEENPSPKQPEESSAWLLHNVPCRSGQYTKLPPEGMPG